MSSLLLVIINWTFNLLFIAILGRIILSFVIPMLGERPNPLLLQIYGLMGQLTDPILGPIRTLLSRTLLRLIPALSMFDFSPLVAIIILQVVRGVLIKALT